MQAMAAGETLPSEIQEFAYGLPCCMYKLVSGEGEDGGCGKQRIQDKKGIMVIGWPETTANTVYIYAVHASKVATLMIYPTPGEVLSVGLPSS